MLILGITSQAAVATFTPTDIAGLQLWLDADDASTITLNGTDVSQWDDKSGNAYNFDQGTAANQPARTLSAQNGKTALTFGGNDFLKNTSLNWGSSNSTLFIVAKENNTSGTGFQNLFTTGTGATGEWGYGISSNSSGNKLSIFDIGQAWSPFDFAPTSSDADVICFTSAGISSGTVDANLFVNGTADTLNPRQRTSTTSATGAQLGAAASAVEAYYGTICEIIMYDTQLSATDRGRVESYLKTKWATV